MPDDDAVRAGQAVYSRRSLKYYDLVVHGLSNRFVWKCPTARIRELYDRNVSANHLDIGVGTGYFLDHCRFPSPDPRLTLLDLNPTCLQAAAERVARYHPATIQASVFEPIPCKSDVFDSVGITYLLHCLPGSMKTKSCTLDNILRVMRPGGVLFGATLLSQGVEVGFLARRLMRLYNARRVFANAGDSLDDLRDALQQRFAEIRIDTCGCAALFVARKRR